MSAWLESAEVPVRVERSGYRRGLLLSSAVIGAWLVLAGRLVQLQLVERETFARQANRQRFFIEEIAPRPGNIVDRHGRLLATTVTAKSLFLDPSQIEDAAAVAEPLAAALAIDGQELRQRLEAARDRQFLWVKRRLTDAEVASVRALDLPEGAWGFRDEYQRRYPQGRLAAHVLGLRDIDNVGRSGIERECDGILRGSAGRRALVRDARGRVVEVDDESASPPRHGATVALTIDAVVQLYAERELDQLVEEWRPKGASVIVMDPATSDVLAMASRPAFDPNRPHDVPDAAWTNTAIAASYEPGSTFKPMIVAWALETGVLRPDEEFDCESGAYRMGGRILHDHHPYGLLSVTDVLVKSSNIGMAKIGERLTNAGIHAAAVRFGFGSRTGIDLPGEAAGILRPLDEWNLYSTGSVPMGQEISATPLQVITAHAALANGGRLMTPRIILGIGAVPTGESAAPDAQVVSRVVRPEVAQWLVTGPMAEVVSRGTGRQARLEGYAVFGKSGTAQKPDPQTGMYSSRLHVSSFVAGAPAEDPRVLVLVVVDEPSVEGTHYGGEVAAPAAAAILRSVLAHLDVPPRNQPDE